MELRAVSEGHAGRDGHVLHLDLFEGVLDAADDGGGVLLTGMGQQNDEFIPSPAEEEVAAPAYFSQDFRRGLQQVVPHLVAESVVGHFQAVEIAHYNAEGKLPVAVEPLQLLFEERPVVQTGKRILEGVPGQALAGGLELRDIPGDSQDGRFLPAEEGEKGEHRLNGAAVLPPDDSFRGKGMARFQVFPCLFQPEGRWGREDCRHVGRQKFLGCETEPFHRRRIDFRDFSGEIVDKDEFSDTRHQAGQ
ncbi:hypothetical protein SDC9_55709 [bioreactor metagenome]|uniref:Uncharacterized protein n=1 Tax=bioreactor metagenome TaxID=1076179 RepID=A0A644WZV6_9ZZZZ